MRRLQVRRDDGATLVEVMVIVALLTMIMGFVGTTVISGVRTTAGAASRMNNQGAVRTALDSMTKTVRTAVKPDRCAGSTAFTVAGTRDVTFYANINTFVSPGVYTGPQQIRYWLVTDPATGERLLRESVTPAVANPAPDAQGCPNYIWPASGTTSRVIARGVTFATPTTPLFTYFAAANTTAPGTAPDSHVSTVPMTGGYVNAVDLETIDAVEMRLSVNAKSAITVPPSTLVDRVSLVNADVR